MARHWLGRKRAEAEVDPDGPDAHADQEVDQEVDQESEDAQQPAEPESEDKPAEAPDVPALDPAVGHAPEVPSAAARPGVPARRLGSTLVTGLVARRPAARAALQPRLPRLVVSFGAGMLLYASFPSTNWWWSAIVALALLAWVLTHRATTPIGGLGYGFLFGLAFYVTLLPWVGILVGATPWLVLATASAGFPGVFGLFAVVVRRLPGWPIWFAVLWGAQEWLKSIFPFGGFPWGSLAFGQTGGPLLPLAQLGGVPLLSIAVVLVGSSMTAIALEIEKWWRAGHTQRSPDRPRDPSGPGDSSGPDDAEAPPPPPAVVLPAICICLVLLTAVIVWPQVRHSGAGAGGEPTVTVAVVQGNVPRLGLDFNSQRRAVLDNHVRETLLLAEDVQAGLAPQPQFVIWPEDSSDIDPFVNADAAQGISAAADAIGAPILVGTLLDAPGQAGEIQELTNTVIVWNPVTGPADRHDKAIVQPFGEYLPMPWLFQHLSGYATRAGHIVPRPGTGVVRIAGVPVGVATCWEVIFDSALRNSVLNGAQLLTVPSNNATFNETMSEQQLAFAKVRAVEHDRYVLVAGTTGISAVIAPDGVELARTNFFEPAYLDSQVRLKTRVTPATRWAAVLQWILVGAAGAIILAAIRHNGWFPRPTRRRSRAPGDTDEPDAPAGESDDSGARSESDGSLEDENNTPPDEGGRYSHGFGRHKGAT